MAPEGTDSALPPRTSAPVRVGRGGGDFRPDGGFDRVRAPNKGGACRNATSGNESAGTPLARSLETIIGGEPADPPSLLAQMDVRRRSGDAARFSRPAVSPSASEPASAPTRCP